MTLPEPPSANRYWRLARHPYPRLHRSAAATAYIKTVRQILAVAWPAQIPYTGPVRLSMVWYRRCRRGDVSNRFKVLEDALQGLVYEDDSQVIEGSFRRDDRQLGQTSGCVVVTITPLGEPNR